jgi:uncharacterized damage-inducible protein DinB
MSAYGAAELAASFRLVRKNTLQIAEDIPEEQYSFVPAPGTRSVSELLRHIAYSPIFYDDVHGDKRLTTLRGYDFGVIFARIAQLEAEPRNKTEIIDLLNSEGERFGSWLASLSPEFLDETLTDPAGQNPKTRLENLMGAKEHEMHHRGQLMLIQRIIGVVPHLTRQRQERTRARETAKAL